MTVEKLYSDLRDLVRSANFDDDKVRTERPGGQSRTVREIAMDLKQALKREVVTETLRNEALVQLAECNDYYGDFQGAADVSASGQDIPKHLPQQKVQTWEQRLRQSQIRLAVSHGRSLYRADDFEAAEDFLLGCRNYVNEFLRTPTYPCFGTLGEIAYILGRVFRQGQRFESSRREFNTAIHRYEQKAHWTPDSLEFSKYKMATIAALGLSWCAYSMGALSTALFGHLASARLLLNNGGDILNARYSDVVHAAAVRALDGREKANLHILSETVQRAADTFGRYGHTFYEAGAVLELAFIALARGEDQAALNYSDGIRELKSFRWRFGRSIVRSRAFRHLGKIERARDAAGEALSLARSKRSRVSEIDALMVLSDTFGGSERSRAIDLLNTAMQLNRVDDVGTTVVNPRIHVACSLNKANHQLEMGQLKEAEASFSEWLRSGSSVENARIQKMASDIESRIGRGKKLVIDVEKEGFSYRTLNARLRRFLLIEAARQGPTVVKIANLIEEPREKVYKWLEEFKTDSTVEALGLRRRPGRKKAKAVSTR